MRRPVSSKSMTNKPTASLGINKPLQEDSTDDNETEASSVEEIEEEHADYASEYGHRSETSPTLESEKVNPEKPEKVLNMFHISFVMQPPSLEHHHRVNEMYHHVVKKFVKDLACEQSRSNYVARQSSTITSTFKNLRLAKGR